MRSVAEVSSRLMASVPARLGYELVVRCAFGGVSGLPPVAGPCAGVLPPSPFRDFGMLVRAEVQDPTTLICGKAEED